jgi:hypothetical protein
MLGNAFSYNNNNNKILDKNQNRISVNCLQPKQSKFLDSLYKNSEEEIQYQSEKSNTYRSGFANSEYFSEFNVGNESMPFRLKSSSENESKESLTSQKVKKSLHTFIGYFRFYFHCSVCLTILAGESN